MTDVQIYAGTLTASQNDRTATGLLVPFGEECSSNLGRFKVDSAAFSVPADLTGLGLNIEHERENVVGAVSKLAITDQGVVATFSFAKTPEGDQALEDARVGKRRNLSAEVAGVVIQGGRAIAGRIFGAALVKAGAFPSATLLAAAIDTEEPAAPAEEPQDTVEKFSEEITGEDGITRKKTTTRKTHVEGDKTTITETIVIEEPEPPAEEEAPVGAATVPNTLVASGKKKEDITASDVFEMITGYRTGESDGTLLAALADIKTTGTGQLPVGGTAIQPAWLGEVWAEKAYTRRYMPLIRNGDITAFEEKGFAIADGNELIQPWAGNKTELPTGGGTTVPFSSVWQGWGWAADIAREFYDIPAGRPVIEAFLRKSVTSYSRVTDKWTLQKLYAAAGSATAAESYPTGYSPAIGKVIQAIDAVDDTDIDCTFVIVAPDIMKGLRYTPKDQIPEYITFSLRNVNEAAQGEIVIVKDKFGVLGNGQVLAGGRDVAHVNELPGATPLQISALDIAKGGIDEARIGYTQYMTEYATGLELVGVVA